MKSKTLTILVAVLVVLAALKYMQTVRHRASLRQTGLESLVADLPATDMGRLVITGPSGKDVVLARSGSDWVLESSFGHPASASNIERLLGSLSGLKGEFRSDKEEVLADYGLDVAGVGDILEDIMTVCGAILIILGLIAAVGGFFGLQRKHFGLVILGGVLGLFIISPYMIASILSLIGLILVAISKKDFD